MRLTAVAQKSGDNYIGWIEEISGVNSQADTLDELYENLAEAAEMVIIANKELTREVVGAGQVQRKVIDVDF